MDGWENLHEDCHVDSANHEALQMHRLVTVPVANPSDAVPFILSCIIILISQFYICLSSSVAKHITRMSYFINFLVKYQERPLIALIRLESHPMFSNRSTTLLSRLKNSNWTRLISKNWVLLEGENYIAADTVPSSIPCQKNQQARSDATVSGGHRILPLGSIFVELPAIFHLLGNMEETFASSNCCGCFILLPLAI